MTHHDQQFLDFLLCVRWQLSAINTMLPPTGECNVRLWVLDAGLYPLEDDLSGSIKVTLK